MKKFLLKLSYTVLPVSLILFGLVAYVSLYLNPKSTGDLGHLAYIPFGVEYDQMIWAQELEDVQFLTVNSTEELKNIHVNVLTVGDSFSQQENSGYQNYMPGEGLTVANCKRSLYDNPIQYAYNILDAGAVDSTNIDAMVVEVGERDFVIRINNFSVDKVEVPDPELPSSKKKGDENEWSLLRARDYVLYLYAGRSPVYVADLKQDFFVSDEPRKLYFYCADVINGLTIDESVRPKIKYVYDLLTRKAHERGITLIIMVPVDKYDLYQDYIVANPYPHPKRINEDIREILGDIPEVMLCKFSLLPLLKNGEKDVFLFNNSHWSYKASEIVGIELSKRVKNFIK